MAAQAIPARIVVYTNSHGTYQVISNTGKRALAKDPRPIDKKDESDAEDTSEWPTKPIKDL